MGEDYHSPFRIIALFPEVDLIITLKKHIQSSNNKQEKKELLKIVWDILVDITIDQKNHLKLAYLYQIHLITKEEFTHLEKRLLDMR